MTSLHEIIEATILAIANQTHMTQKEAKTFLSVYLEGQLTHESGYDVNQNIEGILENTAVVLNKPIDETKKQIYELLK